MKIILEMNDFFKVFPQYETELKQVYNNHMAILEENHFKIEKIKNKEIKSIFKIQLGTKVDFGLKVIKSNIIKTNVIEENRTGSNISLHITDDTINKKQEKNTESDISLLPLYNWEIQSPEMNNLHALMLRNDTIILDWDTTVLDSIDLIDYIKGNYGINVEEYESKKYIGEGVINWNTITEDVKKNWDDSFFFLDNMGDKNFVKNNKELIFSKVKDNPAIFKQVMNESAVFLEYALENVSIEKMLLTMEDNPKILAIIWNSKINDIKEKSNYQLMLKKEEEKLNEDLNNYREFCDNESQSYRYSGDNYDKYDTLKKQLEKEMKLREKEIKKESEKNQIIEKEINKLLDNETLKSNLVKGLLKNNINPNDFIYFQDYIIEHDELKQIVISQGLYDSLATTKKFVDTLNNKELFNFLKTCDLKIKSSVFSSADKSLITKIISEEKLLSLFRSNEGNMNKFEILSNIYSTNKELKKYLFKTNPKERFEELNKMEVTEEDIKLYIGDGGYLHVAEKKFDIYALENIETIKLLCEKQIGFLGNKKIPESWKTNKEIIRTVLMNNQIDNSNLSKANVLELSKDIDFVKEVVSQDNSNSFYKLLPENLKNNKTIAQCMIHSGYTHEIEGIVKILPEFLLLDKNINITLIRKSTKAIKYLNSDIWNDKQFVLTLFSEIEGTQLEKTIKQDLPEKIQFFLETFNIQEKFYTFFNNYYLQKKLESNVVNELPRAKVKTRKI